MEAKERRTRTFKAPHITGHRVIIDCGSPFSRGKTLKRLKRGGRQQIRDYARELASGQITAEVFKARTEEQIESIILGARCFSDTACGDDEILDLAMNQFEHHMDSKRRDDLDAITAAVQNGELSPDSELFNARIGKLVNF